MKGRKVIATSSQATLSILVAAAVIAGALYLIGVPLSSTPVTIEPAPWSLGSAVVGLLRVGLLSGVGVAITAAAIWATRRWRR